jgi:hypothetical protein
MKTILILVLAVVVVSCGKKSASNPPKQSVYEITGDKAQRIVGVTKILSAKATLPSVLQDAFFLEEQTGDGQLGPSDFSTFCVVVVAMEEKGKWTAILTPMQTSPEYSKPRQTNEWWISEQEFKSLEFFRPGPLSTRSIGWVGVSTNSGKIYIHTETM